MAIKNTFFHKLQDQQGQRGIAILLIISSVVLLSILLANFTFDTSINKIKVQNQQDKTQARLIAESGLYFAIAKLKLYQIWRNYLEKNKSVQSFITPEQLESILVQPFIFPIPVPPKANVIQKDAINNFLEDTVLKGSLSLSMSAVSGFLNPNNMRPRPPSPLKKIGLGKSTGEGDENESEEDDQNASQSSPQVYMETTLTESLKNIIKRLGEDEKEGESFQLRYNNLDPELLIKELKFYIGHSGNWQDGENSNFAAEYDSLDITPKHAPLTSINELYLLLGWNDKIIEILKGTLSVHEVGFIPINEINSDQLRGIFPAISNEQVKEFFKYRDGSAEENITGQKFLSVEDFKNFVTGQLAILDEEAFDERAKEFRAAGLEFGLSGKLFKVRSAGSFGRSQYTILAHIDLPIKQAIPTALPRTRPKNNRGVNPDDPPPPPEENTQQPQILELLEPRVVEIEIY